MNIPFTKMHGLGNSYIYIDGYQVNLQEQDLPEIARQVSSVHTGIGSDGLIMVLPSEVADVRMRIFNRDGSEAMNCGNGLRCVAKFAYEYQYVQQETFYIEAKSGVVQATVHLNDDQLVESVTVDMGEPILARSAIPMETESGGLFDEVIHEQFRVDGDDFHVTAVSMGNPHAIFFQEQIEDAPLYTLGPKVTNDDRFPEGVNVEFVEVVKHDEIKFRVWERGSGITQACGTGACAAVVASSLNGYLEREQEVTVHLDGGDLWITWLESGSVSMRGPAVTVAQGDLWVELDV
ncbi:diaminopimelate epimerase [Alkalibacillus almallahensis]|uniref:diaminopimelate epimerase n=1 Tax=Alkalibacillus almallahensis TaxID=1379154 RepID=UPI0014228D01|nr:diaminopimelate epimerase [Alkalibacillus almallahensis]NIK12176.1 diaminopimelate epimerase [Alkalibacillus almallahensis]